MSAPTATGPTSPEALVDYAKSLDCIHCGLCLNTCPTYRLTGREASSPRGRVHLMRAVAEERLAPDAEFAEEMDFCLVCRHCESACPAGVQFGAMMELTRDRLGARRRKGPLARLARWLGFRVVLPSRGWLAFVAGCARLAQGLGLGSLSGSLRALPLVPSRRERRPLPARTPAEGETVARASVLAGCVMPELFPGVNRATVRCLAAAGVEAHAPDRHVCCGALHAHNGDLAGARRLARRTIEAFEALPGHVVVNSAGCGAHMKEYGRLLEADGAWAERARVFAARVTDFTEYLAEPGRLARLTPRLQATGGLRATWDDPCHLCHGQQVRGAGPALVDAVPGVERVAMPGAESCCGSAGVYSILRPADGRAVLAPKLEELAATGATALVTANPGCQMQWASGVRAAGLAVEVLHVAELLERALE